jgi:hypothetical protein
MDTLALFQVALTSDICTDVDDCNIDIAGILCIIASILWAGAGCTTLALKKRPEPVLDAHAQAIEGKATANPLMRTYVNDSHTSHRKEEGAGQEVAIILVGHDQMV